MSKISAVRKAGVMARVGGQLARQLAGRSRTLAAIGQAARTTGQSMAHVLGQLWLEATGAVFIFMAGVGGIALAREWTKYQAGHATPGRLAIAACFTLTFAWFGVSSFLRVRRRGRRAVR
jgi:hypothetical protein